MIQWLALCTSSSGGMDSISGQGTKIPHAMLCGQKVKKRKNWKVKAVAVSILGMRKLRLSTVK